MTLRNCLATIMAYHSCRSRLLILLALYFRMKMAKSVALISKRLQEIIGSHVAKKGFDQWFGRSVNVISVGKGSCVMEMTIEEEHVDAQGHLHGGCTATLVDMATGLALTTIGKTGVSIEINVAYHQHAKLGEKILLDAKTLSVGKTLAFLALDIRNKTDESLIATGRHTMFLDKSYHTGNKINK